MRTIYFHVKLNKPPRKIPAESEKEAPSSYETLVQRKIDRGGGCVSASPSVRRYDPPPPFLAQRRKLPRMAVMHSVMAACTQAYQIPQRPRIFRPVLTRPHMVSPFRRDAPPVSGALAASVPIAPKGALSQSFPSRHGKIKKPKSVVLQQAQAQRLRRIFTLFRSRSSNQTVPHLRHITGSALAVVSSLMNSRVFPHGQRTRPSIGFIIHPSRFFRKSFTTFLTRPF